MALADHLAETLAPQLETLGYELVRVQLMGGGGRTTLQIMAERQDDVAMGVEDCETISHHVSEYLDVADPVKASYILEVSSPGIDRPLTRLKDFARFSGFEAKVQLRTPCEGQRNFCGKLCGVEGDTVSLEIPSSKKAGVQQVRFPFAEVEAARLVMTDELLKASAGRV
ncbi:MAG: ribosome maturation factor RimP [Proteobacteria bacterium]|nr:ribosome maturation factor RimP [Pseudomonadota bacterium]